MLDFGHVAIIRNLFTCTNILQIGLENKHSLEINCIWRIDVALNILVQYLAKS